jgi:hypothetical protein
MFRKPLPSHGFPIKFSLRSQLKAIKSYEVLGGPSPEAAPSKITIVRIKSKPLPCCQISSTVLHRSAIFADGFSLGMESTVATYRGAGLATRIAYGFRRSCFSKHGLPPCWSTTNHF